MIMAEGGVTHIVREEWHGLLVGLKTTVEGLLANPSTNVWSIYGGLGRLCHHVEEIMNHRLKVTQGQFGSSLDYWNFIRGLRWLNPVSSPVIEQYHKMTRGGSLGQAWLRQSLLDHNLSNQLQILVGSRHHLKQHYYEDAYLCQAEYFQALLICLHAVEQNRGALLAEIDPILLSRRKGRKKSIHVRSASLPIVSGSGSDMIRRASQHDRLVPPIMSPKPESVLTISDQHATPCSIGSSPEESARDALRNVLNKTGGNFEDDFDIYADEKYNDPLMNMEIIPRQYNEHAPLQKSASFSSSTKHESKERKNAKSRGKSSGAKLKKSKGRTADLLDNILNEDGFQGSGSVVKVESQTTASQDLGTSGRCANLEEQSSTSCNPSMDDAPQSESLQRSCAVVDRSRLRSVDGSVNSSQGVNATDDYKAMANSTKQSTRPKEPRPSTPSKRMSHHRSMSDYGVPQKTLHMDGSGCPEGAPTEAGDTVSLSSSLPDKGHSGRESYFRQPEKGQSLMSFLSSQDFNTCADLDKENAHFSISEALIAAIEQMKWNQVLRPQRDSDHEYGDSDEEIQQLKQRIRIRRRERMKEKARGFPTFSDGKTDTTTPTVTMTITSSGSPVSSSSNSLCHSEDSSSSSEEVHDTEIADIGAEKSSKETNLTSLRESGLSLSLASLYSEADIKRNNATMERSLDKKGSVTESMSINHSLTYLSAESVAISLLKRFHEKQLPKASELEWMVSEQDAPQALLPLPDSIPVSPDDNENADLATSGKNTRIRGNLEWAPPRAQIIFNIHPPPKRKVLLAKQNFRCAGCGAKVEPGYLKRYRYCEYLGKYFCPCCHTNQLMSIPGRILRKWDFTKHYVSNFARDLLRRIYNDPLFNLDEGGGGTGLYRKVRAIDQIREARLQLHHLHVFLKTCRFGTQALSSLESCPGHWASDVHLYSLAELVQVKKGELHGRIKNIVNECVAHVTKCQLCLAKGFICELCNKADDIIFPFQLLSVKQCLVCRACYHKLCFTTPRCPKCARIEARKCQREVETFSDEGDGDSSPQSR